MAIKHPPYVFQMKSGITNNWDDMHYLQGAYSIGTANHPFVETVEKLLFRRASTPSDMNALIGALISLDNVADPRSKEPLHKTHVLLLTSYFGTYFKKKNTELKFTPQSFIAWLTDDALAICEHCFNFRLDSYNDPGAYKPPEPKKEPVSQPAEPGNVVRVTTDGEGPAVPWSIPTMAYADIVVPRARLPRRNAPATSEEVRRALGDQLINAGAVYQQAGHEVGITFIDEAIPAQDPAQLDPPSS